MDIWLATLNKNKVKEFRDLFKSTDYTIRAASELDFYKAPKEDGDSFVANALIKAKSLKAAISNKDCWVVGEDSGLEVEGLNGLPGIHSARYAGENALDIQNNDKLVKMLGLRSPQNRKARYWCQIVAIGPNNQELEIGAPCNGLIGVTPKGSGGFGYDPLFIPEGFEKTMAELLPAEKHEISHRGKAAREFLNKLTS